MPHFAEKDGAGSDRSLLPGFPSIGGESCCLPETRVYLLTALVPVLATGVIVDVLIRLHVVGKHQQRILYKFATHKQTR